LGSPIRSLEEIYNRLGDLPFTTQFKYDGQRAQIHASKTDKGPVSVRIFSRHLEDMTSKVSLSTRTWFETHYQGFSLSLSTRMSYP
jgi:ATP-dependent DNA ligase